MRSIWRKALFPLAAGLLALSLVGAPAAAQEAEEEGTFNKEEIYQAANDFFGETTEGLAKVVERIFADHGQPNAYITGDEVSGAVGVGVRYGEGQLTTKTMGERKVYWQGPSIGFDLGGNAAKVFVLVYDLNDVERLFQRFPAVDGSLFVIAGLSVNYHESEGIALAPIRTGVGLRAGVNVGYMHYTREQTWVPL